MTTKSQWLAATNSSFQPGLKFGYGLVYLSWAQLGSVGSRTVPCVFIPRPMVKEQQLPGAYFSHYRGHALDRAGGNLLDFINPQLELAHRHSLLAFQLSKQIAWSSSKMGRVYTLQTLVEGTAKS